MRRTTGVLIVAVLAGLFWASRPRPAEGPGDAIDAGETVGTESAVRQGAEGIPIVTLDASDCRDAGYLCAELDRTGDLRAVRWPDGTERIRVLVTQPEGIDRAQAQALQRRAAAGIREWQGRPFALEVRAAGSGADGGGAADVVVRWVPALDDDRVGQASIRWGRIDGVEAFEVDSFLLALNDPSGRPVTPDRVQLTAAHEMGHVLGLPHSDDEADVMYPFNTATRLTFRDFRTIEVLYRLPAGARLVRASGR
jgi:hypothetical protein